MDDVIVESFEYHNIPKNVLPMATVYYNTSDYPEKYVARLWLINEERFATNAIILADSLDEIRRGILKGASPFSTCFARSEEDDKCIVESWV